MIIIVGLIILIVAVVTGVAGVLSNSGSGHALTHHFAVFASRISPMATSRTWRKFGIECA